MTCVSLITLVALVASSSIQRSSVQTNYFINTPALDAADNNNADNDVFAIGSTIRISCNTEFKHTSLSLVQQVGPFAIVHGLDDDVSLTDNWNWEIVPSAANGPFDLGDGNGELPDNLLW